MSVQDFRITTLAIGLVAFANLKVVSALPVSTFLYQCELNRFLAIGLDAFANDDDDDDAFKIFTRTGKVMEEYFEWY